MPRWFVSEVVGSKLEWSTHDDTIKTLIPDAIWIPVYSFPGVTLKTDVIDDSLIYLIGHGADSDASGRMSLFRYTADRAELAKECSPALGHMAACMAGIEMMLEPYGFEVDRSVWDTISQN